MQNRKSTALCLGLLATALLPSAVLANAWEGRWGQPFDFPIIPIHATLLPDGQVFTFGTDPAGNQGAQFQYHVWNFWAGWGAHTLFPNNYGTDIFCAATELLPNGDVLIAGGDTRNPINLGIKDSMIFRTGDKGLQRTGYMNFARWYPTLTTLPNGELLVHGGKDGGNAPVATPEVFNNGGWRNLWGATNWDIINDGEGKWFYPRNWVAPNGRVFGITGNVMYFLDWGGDGGTQIAGYLPNKSRSHTSSAVMYRPGQILQVGGSTNGDTQAEGSRQAISVDVTSGWPQVRDEADMGFRRVWASTTVLANGEVLVTGGSAFENKDIDSARTAEMWNPDSRQFRRLATANLSRLYHSVALLLPDASVMVGGGGAPGPWIHKNAEIYWPPYLFNGGDFAARPTIEGNFQTDLGYNATVNVGVGGAGGVSRVTLVRNGSVTHSFDMGQRFLDLAFTNVGNGTVNVRMPGSANDAPPGYYMMFFINNAGVPSVARILHLHQGGGNPGGAGGGGGGGGGLENGAVYELRARHSGKCVDVAGASGDNGANIQQYTCNQTNAQKFRLQDIGGGNWNLVNINSNKCIDVADVGQANGQRIQQWDCIGGQPNQRVKINGATDGSYQVVFQHSNKCLDVGGVSQDDGVPLHQWDCIGGQANQEFFFVK